MKELENKILSEGKVLPGQILKVGSFLNQQVDVRFNEIMGSYAARMYSGTRIDRVLTIEASGIPLAYSVASHLNVPMTIARKGRAGNMTGEMYVAEVYSYTHQKTYNVMVSKDHIKAGENILIVDDFLALGNAVRGLTDIISQAGASVAGVTAAIEKGFQGGGDKLRAEGIRVESLAVIDEMRDDGTIVFRS